MREPDADLLARLERLYGRGFLRQLVGAGEQALRAFERGEPPTDEIIARILVRHGRAVRHHVQRSLVDGWRPTAPGTGGPLTAPIE